MMTENGVSAQVDNVTPRLRLGGVDRRVAAQRPARRQYRRALRPFRLRYQQSGNGYPARQFWFDAYNDEHCGANGKRRSGRGIRKRKTFGGCAPGFEADERPGRRPL
jgi:hypothetical protein